jgi:hypothetical protein
MAVVERLAEQVLMDRQEAIEYEKRRNGDREALNALKRAGQPSAPSGAPRTAWLAMGSLFVRFPHAEAEALVRKEQEEITREIERLREDVKKNVTELEALQGRTVNSGYSLKSLAKDQLYGSSL